MPKPDVEKLGPDLSAYLDGELTPQRRAEIEQLLESSPEARRRLEDLRGAADAVNDLPRMAAPDALVPAMRRQAERRLLLDAPQSPAWRRWWLLPMQVSATAAVVALCVLVGWHALRTPVEPAPDTALMRQAAPVAEDRSSEAPTMRQQEAFGAAESPSPSRVAVAPKSEAIARRQDESAGVATLAEEPASLKTRSGRAGRRESAAFGEDAQGGGGRLYATAAQPPEVEVVVAPQSQTAYARSAEVTWAWQRDVPRAPVRAMDETLDFGEVDADVDTAGAARDVAAVVALGEPQEWNLVAGANEVGVLLAQLEETAPQQVKITMNAVPAPQLLQMQNEYYYNFGALRTRGAGAEDNPYARTDEGQAGPTGGLGGSMGGLAGVAESPQRGVATQPSAGAARARTQSAMLNDEMAQRGRRATTQQTGANRGDQRRVWFEQQLDPNAPPLRVRVRVLPPDPNAGE